jgi:hypothetical protein
MYRYLLVWYCHLVPNLSPPYITLAYLSRGSCGELSRLSIVDSWIGNPLYKFHIPGLWNISCSIISNTYAASLLKSSNTWGFQVYSGGKL